MTAGHSPFDINPRDKQARIARSVPYEILLGLALVLAVGSIFYAMAWYERARIVAGPLLQARADGSLLVAWRTAAAPRSRLEVNPSANLGDRGAQVIAIEPMVVDGQFVAPLPPQLMNYSYSTYMLRTSMLLFYRSQGPWTISQPQVDTPFRFAVFGESGGSPRPHTMAAAILQTQPHLVLHIGDLIQETGAWGGNYDSLYWKQFYEPYSTLANTMPFMPVIGGHEARIEAGTPFRRFFVLPQNGPQGLPAELSYWFDYGTARFVAIDTSASDQVIQDRIVPWLQKVLAGAPTSWKFVFMHHSPYTGSRQNPPDERVQRILVPQFEALGVDVVFSAGNRLYERTHPLRKGEVKPAGEGTVYITTGAGGRGLHVEQRPPPPYIAAYEDKTYSFTFVELVDGRLHLRQVGEYGQLIDDWWFAKPIPAPPALTQPAGLPTTQPTTMR